MQPKATVRLWPWYRRNQEARAKAHEHAADPDEDRHVGRERAADLAERTESRADPEGALPADNGADQTARDHERAAHERVDHVGELDLRRGGTEVVRERGGGERQGAVVARGAHLRENEYEDRKDRKALHGRTARSRGVSRGGY